MKKQLIGFLGVILLISSALKAQNSYKENPSLKWYSKAVLAFDKEEYFLAKEYFSKVVVENYQKSSVEVYMLLINMSINEKDAAEKTESYLNTNPFSAQSTDLILALSNLYFSKKKHKKALEWYDKLDVSLLSEEQESNYNYKLAFANYTQKNFAKSKEYLMPLSKSGEYQDEAHYYLGSIATVDRDYDEALYHFNFIEKNPKYQKEIGYQKVIVLYQQKKYQEAVLLGEVYYPKVRKQTDKSELSKVIGESLFYLKKYEEAVPYLSSYKGRKNKLSETDYYILGYAYYKSISYNEAIANFNKITDSKNAVSQNAHYHLGDCYLKLDKKIQALNAFKNASEMSFDTDIQQGAFLNYAKLSYEIGNPYKSTSEVLQSFVDAYPNAPETSHIKDLIVNAYLQFKDYQGAIDYYQTQRIIKDEQYQKILLHKGFELFNNKDYKNALSSFTEATNMYNDKKIKQQALFWKAESLSELFNFENAIYDYDAFVNNVTSKSLEEYQDGVYGLAYSLFQQKKYEGALKYFEKYVAISNDSVKKRNAILRIADCNYVTKSYWNALENYNKIITENEEEVDYATYQKALAYGFLGKNNEKKETLKELQSKFKTSAYLDKSYYVLGNLHGNKSQNELALKAYRDLMEKYPKSPLVAQSKLKSGIIYFNLNNNNQAIKVFKNIVENYPGTAESVQSVKMAEEVYKEIGQVDVYAKWVKGLEFVNISDSDIDKSMFEVVENKYFANDLEGAISNAKKYLINFPNGIHALTVHFYLAQSYFNTDAKEKSIEHYQEVLEVNTNEYTEVSLNKLSQIYLENEEWDLASELLIRIENEVTNEQSKIYAQSNLMKYYYQKEDYRKTLAYTDIVLENPKSKEDAITDAYLYGGRSAIELKELSKARTFYEKLETIGKGAVKAEANYYKAFWLHMDEEYQKSNEQVQLLASKFQAYKYWGIKGLLLMAKNFHKLQDDFQADFILNNVIKNAKAYDDVMQEAKALLKEYKALENNKKQLPEEAKAELEF